MFRFLGSFNVIPSLPVNIESLREIAYNVIWSWDPDTKELFRRIDRELWESTNHNPVMMLGLLNQERLTEISNDDGFIAHLERVNEKLKRYLTDKYWYEKKYNYGNNFNIVYFSAEFGLTECLQTYSGGLGVLAGDHLKAASDLGLPLIGMGLLYKEGYFQQYLNIEGWQHERYEINDFENLPMKQVKDKHDAPLIQSIHMGDREVFFQVWKIDVGRVALYLLDTNITQNTYGDRKITETLYGGNSETRIKQEIILGIGGIRTIYSLGLKPVICHMNEGHSAFMALEKMRFLMQNEKLTFEEAFEIGYYSNIFTTHTPVPAGIDVFPNELVERYLGNYYRNELGIEGRKFYKLGTIYKGEDSPVFNMAHFAMNTAGYINGVSKLHGEVSKKMWVSGFKDVPFNEIPIGSITNGVHIRSHISREMEELFLKYMGEKWYGDHSSEQLWGRIDKIPDEELWRVHERRRERLVAFVRRSLKKQIRNMGGSQSAIDEAGEVLDPKALTIGFARRFATYKRATLIFKNFERLAEIVGNKNMPVQFIFAGKAHPQDEEGKKLIQEIYQFTKDERLKRKVVFLENYDINVASYLVEGCDVWLNNPRRPLEASGTSGMKVIANGGLNFSVLDGWWCEGFSPDLGWKIGNGEEYLDSNYQDNIEVRQLYHTLENQIIPLFFSRGEDELPRKWIMMIKNSMKQLGPYFNTHRMVKEYFEKYYCNSYEKTKILFNKDKVDLNNLVQWKEKIRKNWPQIKLVNYDVINKTNQLYVDEDFKLNAEIMLGELSPDDVEVQIYYGPADKRDIPGQNLISIMKPVNGRVSNGVYKFKGGIHCTRSGISGFTVRILPKNELLISSFELGVVYWA